MVIRLSHRRLLLSLFLSLNIGNCRTQSIISRLLERYSSDGSVMSENLFKTIFPGTKWCGMGNIAKDYDDLGYFSGTDSCCREHDMCPDIIIAGHVKHGLKNNDFYTKLSCDCDVTFYECLKNSPDLAGNVIGRVYFNKLGARCFKLDHPINKCLIREGFIRKKCVKYDYIYEEEKKYQWLDLPPY